MAQQGHGIKYTEDCRRLQLKHLGNFSMDTKTLLLTLNVLKFELSHAHHPSFAVKICSGADREGQNFMYTMTHDTRQTYGKALRVVAEV